MNLDREFEVDYWRTGMHGIELGIKKQQELMSKSRQFTKDMDIIGQVIEKDDTTRYLAIRTSEWEASPVDRRLILKTFTKGLSWRGSLEQLTAKTMSQSIAARKPLPVFVINLSGTDSLITLERVNRSMSFDKKIFAFTIVDEGIAHPFYFEENRLTFGSDWTVHNAKKQKVANINGSKLNIGGKFVIKMASKGVPNDLDDAIILFTAIAKFYKDVVKSVKKRVKYIQKSKDAWIKLDSDERMLYRNPRKMTY